MFRSRNCKKNLFCIVYIIR